MWNNPVCFFSPNSLFEVHPIQPHKNVCLHAELYKIISELRIKGLGNLIGACTFLMFVTSIILISFNLNKSKIYDTIAELKQISYIKLYFFSVISIILLMSSNLIIEIFLNYSSNKDSNIITSFKNIIFYFLSFIFILLGIFEFKNNPSIFKNIRLNIFYFSIIIILPLTIGLVEVLWGLTYSFTLIFSTGKTIFRATSTFFNPNLYAVWLTIIYFVFSYIYWIKPSIRKMLILPFFLISFSMYLTGSRGVLLIFIFCMILAIILMPREKGRLSPFIIFITSFVSIYTASLILINLDIGIFNFSTTYLTTGDWGVGYNAIGNAGIMSLVNLGDRFFSSPFEVLGYIFGHVHEKWPWLEKFNSLGQYFHQILKAETVMSLDLRFNLNRIGAGSGDSGWMNSIRQFGYLITSIIFLQYLIILYAGIKFYIKSKNINSTLVITIQIFCILINFIIKFYAFPVVIMLSMFQLISLLILLDLNVKYNNTNRQS